MRTKSFTVSLKSRKFYKVKWQH